MLKNGLRAAGVGTPGGEAFGPHLVDRFLASDTWFLGALALEQGFIFTAMLLSAMTVAVIRRRFVEAAVWCGISALLSLAGLLHSFRWTSADAVVSLTPAWPWVWAYVALGGIFLLARWLTVPATAEGASPGTP
jgi:AGZA family xanthine/uracil permease-like MFS transporter